MKWNTRDKLSSFVLTKWVHQKADIKKYPLYFSKNSSSDKEIPKAIVIYQGGILYLIRQK